MIAKPPEAGDAMKLERAAGLLMFLDTPKRYYKWPKLPRSPFKDLKLTDFDEVEKCLQQGISRHRR